MIKYVNKFTINRNYVKIINNPLIFISILVFFLIIFVNSCNAQKMNFTYEQVYGKGLSEIMVRLPVMQDWLDKEYYLTWMSNEEGRKTKLMKIHAETGESEIIADFSQVNAKFMKGRLFVPWEAYTKDYKEFIISFDGDLHHFSGVDGSIRQLTDTKAKEKNPTFSPDGGKIAFTRDYDLYTIDIETGEETRLTDDGSNLIYNGYASWVYYEEIIGRRSKYKAFWWAPDSKMIAFLRFDDTLVPEFPIYHSEGIRGFLEVQRYPKSGDPNPAVKLGVIHLDEGTTVWIDTDEKVDSYIAWPSWSPDSKKLLFQSVNRGQDMIRIYKSDPYCGLKKMIYEEKQPSWVEFFKDLYLFEDGKGFLLRSDKTGWRHLYFFDMDGNLIQRLTDGEWNVSKIVRIDEKNGNVYFQGFQKNSTETHLFKIALNGSKIKKLTRINGTHSVNVSPNGNYFIDTFSNISQPEKMDLYDSDGKFIRTIGDKKSSALENYVLGKVELFNIPTEDGVQLPALWVLPPDFDKSKKYPVIFQVYGGPGRASVRNKYPSFTYHYMAQNNIITIMVDHRGSYHFGKTGQSLMHRNLGKWEMNDYIQAVKWLRGLTYIDQDRIGIVGGSYGGYVVTMALTYGSEYFTHGVALYSVTDWHLYDNVYTERYMDMPAENPDGYAFGSALTHAEKFKGRMLIVHGALDDNVHMQNTTKLIQLLQKFDKSFELMIYPNQKHGTRGAWRKHTNRERVNFWFRHFLGRELIIE
jgi:dipeptidyl-peptidase-4